MRKIYRATIVSLGLLLAGTAESQMRSAVSVVTLCTESATADGGMAPSPKLNTYRVLATWGTSEGSVSQMEMSFGVDPKKPIRITVGGKDCGPNTTTGAPQVTIVIEPVSK